VIVCLEQGACGPADAPGVYPGFILGYKFNCSLWYQ